MVYLSSGNLAAALELLRRVCQPSSRSLPHITARYSSMQVREEVLAHYLNALVGDMILSEVSTFDENANDENGLKTVILKCESEDLEWLSYKPDFPDSVFHFTIYDGPKSDFASQVLAVMKRFPWDLRILGAAERVEPYDKNKAALERSGPVRLTPEAQSLLRGIGDMLRIEKPLDLLETDERLRFIHAICEFIHADPGVETAGFHPINLDTHQISRYAGQDGQPVAEAIDSLSWSESVIPDEREMAMFLTPPELAFDVASAALALLPAAAEVDFGDPAIGPGIFFAALRRAAANRVIRSAVGVEINPDRARATAQRWRRSDLRVIMGDFLTRRPEGDGWNLLLANPPYVRHQEIDRPMGWLRDALHDRTGVRIGGRSDLYTYFILSAHDWLAESAIAAWLVPSEITTTAFAGAIRHYLASSVTVRRLHTYDRTSPLFDNARVSSTVVIYENRPAGPENLVEISRGGTLERPAERLWASISQLRNLDKWSWAALQDDDLEPTLTVGDVFEVKRGIATGANSLFVLDSQSVRALHARKEWLRPILPKSRHIFTDTIHADDSGLPIDIEPLWLIDTRETIEQIATVSPVFAEYLVRVHDEVGGRNLVAQRKPFYAQERRAVPDFVFIYMAKEHLGGERRFIRNESMAVVLNNYLALTLRPEFLPLIDSGEISWRQLHRALQSISPGSLARHGRLYISGLLKLEPAEVRSLPLDLPGLPSNTLV